jgi:hypothetical protein
MKTRTYIRLSLLTPYVLWVFAVIIILLNSALQDKIMNNTVLMYTVGYPSFIYGFGIFLWGIPYTLLALILWLWSVNKDIRQLTRTFALSPITIEAILIQFDWSDGINGLSKQSVDFGVSILGLGALSFAFGYFSIGVAWGLYRLLKRSSFIIEEDDPAILLEQTTT